MNLIAMGTEATRGGKRMQRGPAMALKAFQEEALRAGQAARLGSVGLLY